ncbi:MAG: hypothetical protein GY869_26760 [Planctomycetes bacterium]|nr:hypothetical protein [Planctomycetota bacterium]
MKLCRIAAIILVLLLFCLPANADGPVMTRYDETPLTKSGYYMTDIPVMFVAVDIGKWPVWGHHPVYGEADGVRFRAIVLDTGYFAGKCVKQMTPGECWPIMLDMPTEWYYSLGFTGLSVPVSFEVDRSVWWGLL